MKKYISLIFIVSFLFSLISCRKMPDGNNGSTRSSDYLSVIEETVYITEPEELMESAPKPSEKVYQSTIATPEQIKFYKNGMYGVSENKNLNLEIARYIESWYTNYEFETLPFINLGFDEQFITDIKCSETVIEIYFNYSDNINFLGKFVLGESVQRILVPLTGEYAYYIFKGYSSGKYQGGPYNLGGSGLEKFFAGITIDKTVQNWESTVIAPSTVIFYKDGAKSVSTDAELNHKIAKHIEEWFKYKESIAAASLSANTDLINYNRRNEMAIELQFDDEIKFFGGIISSNTRTLFIPLTGDNDYLIFHNSINVPDDWGGPLCGGSGLEQYFENRTFTPITEEQKRWQTTVPTPSSVRFYENGSLIGESEIWGGYALNREIAEHIESWFYKKENIQTNNVMFSDLPIETAWDNDTYIELVFNGGITFYSEYIIPKEYSTLVIPLTGEFAYCIFAGDNKNFSNTAYMVEGSDLEKFFEKFKVENNS